MRAKRTITFDTVRDIALALPGVDEYTSYGVPAFRVRGRMFACQPSHRSAEPGSLVVRIDFAQREELLSAEPETYYVTDHYVGYTAVLVRLSRVHPDALRGLLLSAHKFMSATPARKVKARTKYPTTRARRP